MSRTRGTATTAAPGITYYDEKSSQNSTGQAPASGRKNVLHFSKKSTQRYSIQEVKPIRISTNSQRPETSAATDDFGLDRLKNFFKRSLSKSVKKPKQIPAEHKLDQKSDTNKTIAIEAPHTTPTEKKVAAYIPQHAASDYSKTALPLSTAHDDSKRRSSVLSASQGAPIFSHPIYKREEGATGTSTDYESFVKTEQQVTTEAVLKRLSQEPQPETPWNISASNFAARRGSRVSVLSSGSPKSHQSPRLSVGSIVHESRIPEGQQTPQTGRSGSLLMKVGDYIKPPRPESTQSIQSMHSFGRRQSSGSVLLNAGDNRNKRWSLISSPEQH